MRNSTSTWSVFLAVCLFLAFSLTFSVINLNMLVEAEENIINVPADFLTIQEALDNASEGATIFVHEKTYIEQIVINKSVSLIGDGFSTIIDGYGDGNVITVTANSVTVLNFTIRNSGLRDSGIQFTSCSGGRVIGNNIVNNYNGINLNYSRDNFISGNNISANSYDGIGLYYSSNNKIADNDISFNNFNAVGIYYSSGNLISNNDVSFNNYDGIGLYYSSNNEIGRNRIISNNFNGMALYYSSNDNDLSGNTFSSNYIGLRLTFSTINNMIYHNNFFDVGSVQSDSTNNWDSKGEGNYWSEYRGQDLDGDGIGENPYMIDENNQDNYPLMGIFSDFTATWEQQDHHITIISNSTISDSRFEVGMETGNRIIHLRHSGKGFCRITIPTGLMKPPYIVLAGDKEVIPTILSDANSTNAILYFMTDGGSQAIAIIYSETQQNLDEILEAHAELQLALSNLNTTYYDAIASFAELINDMNKSYQELRDLNATYYNVLANYSELVKNLNTSYQEHLLNLSQNTENTRNLMYAFATTTGVFITTTVYLSKRAHTEVKSKPKGYES